VKTEPAHVRANGDSQFDTKLLAAGSTSGRRITRHGLSRWRRPHHCPSYPVPFHLGQV